VSYLSGGRFAYPVVACVLLAGLVGCGPIPSDYEQAGATGMVGQGADMPSGVSGVGAADRQVGRSVEADPGREGRDFSDERSINKSSVMSSRAIGENAEQLSAGSWNALFGDLNPSGDDPEFNDFNNDEDYERGGLRTAATGSMDREGALVGSGSPMTLEQYLMSRQNVKR